MRRNESRFGDYLHAVWRAAAVFIDAPAAIGFLSARAGSADRSSSHLSDLSQIVSRGEQILRILRHTFARSTCAGSISAAPGSRAGSDRFSKGAFGGLAPGYYTAASPALTAGRGIDSRASARAAYSQARCDAAEGCHSAGASLFRAFPPERSGNGSRRNRCLPGLAFSSSR